MTHNQADLYLVQLFSLTKLEGELAGDKVVLDFVNLAVEPLTFQEAVERAFTGREVEIRTSTIRVTLTTNAEHLYDGEDYTSDMNAFLEKMAEIVLIKLALTRGWGSADSANLRDSADLHD